MLALGGKGTCGVIGEGLAHVVGSVVGITLGETAGIFRGTEVGRIAMGVRAMVLANGFVVACWKMVAKCCRASIWLSPILENRAVGAGCWRA